MDSWKSRLNADPLPWLLEEDSPAVRAAALRDLLDRSENDPEFQQAHASAMEADPIGAILSAKIPRGTGRSRVLATVRSTRGRSGS